jgi:cysteine desulfurase
MLPYLTDLYGNPSSVHRLGQRSRQAIDEARAKIAALVGCSDSELLFTGGGTEAINAGIRSLLITRSPRRVIVTTTVEHSATRELCQQLSRDGFTMVEVPVDIDGQVDRDRFVDAVSDPNVALATMMYANNETGVIFPVDWASETCKTYNVPFHCDATQAVGKLPVNFREDDFDLGSFASHKFHGPKGVGALFVRKGLRFRPLLIGGPQERNRRGGTENVPGIVGMGRAAELARETLPQMLRVGSMRDRLQREILARVDDSHVIGATHDTKARLPNTTNIGFARLEAEAILLLLSEKGVCASAGAACSSGSLEPSHVIRAMGIPEQISHGAIRFSLSRYTTDAEVDRCLEILPPVIQRLRAVLPVG